MNEHIVVLYASIGTGHAIAAEALSKHLKTNGFKVKTLDILNSVSDGHKKILAKFNIHNPFFRPVYDYFWGMDTVAQITKSFFSLEINRFAGLIAEIEKYKPSAIVSTHLLGGFIGDYLSYKPARFSVITDYRVTPAWSLSKSNKYFVSNEISKIDLVTRGVPAKNIVISGIPLRKQFEDLEQKHVRSKSTKNVLIMGGGLDKNFNSSHNEHLFIRQITKISKKYPTTVICGSNDDLRDELKKIANSNLVIHKTIQNIAQVINDSQLVITKPGGLICAEATALGKPLLFIGQGYGQEKGNASYLTNQGAAVQSEKTSKLYNYVKIIMSSDLHQSLSEKSAVIGKIGSTKLITEEIQSFLFDRKK